MKEQKRKRTLPKRTTKDLYMIILSAVGLVAGILVRFYAVSVIFAIICAYYVYRLASGKDEKLDAKYQNIMDTYFNKEDDEEERKINELIDREISELTDDDE